MSFSKYQITALLNEEMYLVTRCAKDVMEEGWIGGPGCAFVLGLTTNAQNPHQMCFYCTNSAYLPARYLNLLRSGLTQTLGLEGHT